MVRIVIMASGSGSNAQSIIQYFQHHNRIQVALLVTNNPKAFVIERAVKAGIPIIVVGKSIYDDGEKLNDLLRRFDVEYVILAGYLKAIPAPTIQAFPHRILNIHPSLLPHFGGKGMYGIHVHEAVVQARATQSGITIHYVTQEYDEGPIIFQQSIAVDPEWDARTLQQAILPLEHVHYPRVIEEVITRAK
jgi:phosphoribosylglycinamide formyltransferase-1